MWSNGVSLIKKAALIFDNNHPVKLEEGEGLAYRVNCAESSMHKAIFQKLLNFSICLIIKP
jgi:hypothetical protein